MRTRTPLLLAAIAVVCLMLGTEGREASADPAPDAYKLVQDVNTATFTRMVDFAVLPGTNNQQAIVTTQTDARVRRVSLTGAFAPVEFGNLSALVKQGGNEQGLLSLALSPNYASDSTVYAYYTSLSCQAPVIRCARLTRFPVVSNDINEAAGTVVLEIDQVMTNQANHNGGRILFGPDGYLYLSVGDGGGGGDPLETGQVNTDLLASVLRLHVTGQATYAVPPGNPYAGVAGADEVWAYGLRNPWRYSFDRLNGALWLGDVGQGNWEEVEPIIAGGNYGWDCHEGNAVYEAAGCAPPPPGGFQFPREEYAHVGGNCSVTGGYVYRGAAMPELYGWYVFADYCSGRIWAVNSAIPSGAEVQLFDSPNSIASFAERPDGELLVLTFENAIYRLTCAGTDSDGDGVGNACDNCSLPNPDQTNADGDSLGDACDLGDTDGDFLVDQTEYYCGSPPGDGTKRPERLDGPFDNVDDDGDTAIDEALPGGAAAFDCDGDGWPGGQENLIYNDAPGTLRDQDACGNNGWPSDLAANNALNIADIGSFLTPPRPPADAGNGDFNMFNHPLDDDGDTVIESAEDPGTPGGATYNVARWNLQAPPHLPANQINIADLNALITSAVGSTARPPMFGGQQAFFTNLGQCPWPP